MDATPPHGHYLSAADPHQENPVSQPTTPPVDPAVQPTPEPLITAEMIRNLILLAASAGVFGGAQIPDPVLSVAVPIVTGLVGLAVSWGLTMVARGKVWAIRRGVNVDAAVDELQRRTQ